VTHAGPSRRDRTGPSAANVDAPNIAVPGGDGKEKATTMSKIATEGIEDWPWECAIALDGGTTNTRARLVRRGRVVATARRPVGVRDAVVGDRPAVAGPVAHPLARAVREAIAEVIGRGVGGETAGVAENPGRPGVIVAAGMLCAEVGLTTVPHVPAPAGPDDLAAAAVVRSIPEASDDPILFVPGVRTAAEEGPDGWMAADVMRGEECETLGAIFLLARRGDAIARDGTGGVFVWPGSHTKLVEVDPQGRIARSHTSLAGELLQAVARHTLVAASLPAALPEVLDLDAAESGARAAIGRGLGRAAFLVRIAALGKVMGPEARASFWIGALVADDVGTLARHSILSAPRPVWVGGREPLRSQYATRLSLHLGGRVSPLADDLAEAVSAVGALEVAARRVGRPGGEAPSAFGEPAP
jgi:2-dehydro-3-deoxygalactonokinase